MVVESANYQVPRRKNGRRCADTLQKRPKHSNSPATPKTISAPPAIRNAATSKNGPSNSHCEMIHGTYPATTPGATTRKIADPIKANSFLTETILSPVATPARNFDFEKPLP